MNPPVTRVRKSQLDTLAITLLVLCCAFWGFQQILIKFAVAEIPPLWQAALRFWGATVLLWLWCRLRGVPLFDRDGTLKSGLLAGLLFAGEFAAIYLGLMHTSASRLTVFLYTSPFVVALLLPRVVPGEKLRRMQWIGLVMAFGAVALAFSEGFLQSSPAAGQWRGDALGLGAKLWGSRALAVDQAGLTGAHRHAGPRLRVDDRDASARGRGRREDRRTSRRLCPAQGRTVKNLRHDQDP